ncbi:hypothetical protein FKP32DRAFT_1575007 [Trametes sanguinea]|nr:hypothetical protein FKP32DRAFT_1575007 [Trametes sanguinea]
MSTRSRNASNRSAKAAAAKAAEAAFEATKKQLRSLSTAIIVKPPYCYGTVPLAEDNFVLFYGKDESARRINLSRATAEQLQHLAETCDPATFGVDGQDVYDETYRKAGKLDARHFSLNLSPAQVGLLDIVRDHLLVETASRAISPDQYNNIHAELYKLNVYGPQSFFKRHVDTPREDTMFGSLVIVFPAPHKGGELVLRSQYQSGEETRTHEWTVDSSHLLSQTDAPSVAYAAFFSDTEHEVLPVQSGYRVTVTYNLHFVPRNEPVAHVTALPRSLPTHENQFKSRFQALLDDPSFLPDGGNLLFSLWHYYPLPTPTQNTTLEESREALRAVAGRLKGTDAMVWHVIRSLGLDASLRIVVQDGARFVWSKYCAMCDHAVQLKRTQFPADTLNEYLLDKHNATLINQPLQRLSRWGDSESDSDGLRVMEVHWVTYGLFLLSQSGQADSPEQTSYMAYGNESSIAHAYWRVSLLVRVGPFGKRATGPQPQQG